MKPAMLAAVLVLAPVATARAQGGVDVSGTADAAAQEGESDAAAEADANEPDAGASQSNEPDAGASQSNEPDAGAAEDAGSPGGGDVSDDLHAGEVLVEGRIEDLFATPGSVHVVDEEVLDRLDYNDPLAQLVQVPGVYVRQEEGFGLRPNIGLRGAAAERSRKITLLEDGVLMAPAPYSAPAAYYFPLIARMTEVEVTLGPSAIVHGPNTVGGAIDFRGRAIPARRQGRVDLSLGNTWYGRLHTYYGDSNEWGGFLLEGIHLRSSGFRHLDGFSRDADTGFHRTDLLARGELHGMLDAGTYHRLELTLGLGLEQSNETYLGLTDEDFRRDPLRRYASSQNDRMEWWRTRVQLRYELVAGEDFDLAITAYRHDFERTWHRLDRVCSSFSATDPSAACAAQVGLDEVLADPARYGDEYEYLTGALARPQYPLYMAINHRIFAVQGLQAAGNARFVTGELRHRVRFGARLHFDEITRDHRGDTWFVSPDTLQMVRDARPPMIDAQNHAGTWALSGYLSWALSWNRLTITPGARAELIWMSFEDRRRQERVVTEQYALLPGAGVQYALTDDLAVFAGAYLGFSPLAPGQAEGTLPETAWNYEVGGRYGQVTDPTNGQLTLFVSDYDNLTTNCASAGGCGAEAGDVQFNGGSVVVLGLEAQAAHTVAVDEVQVPLRASYTWTWSRFAGEYTSDNPQFGQVRPGYELPYVPEHQLAAQVGLVFRIVEVNASATFVSSMRDVAGIGPTAPAQRTDDVFTVDATASVEVLPGVRIYVRGENLTDARPIVSRRPWGARTTRPLLVQAGFRVDFR